MARDEDLDTLQDLAERMGLEGDKASNFVNQGMQRLGYKARMDWDDPDSDDDNNTSDLFGGGGGNQRRSRDMRDRGGRGRDDRGGRRASGGNWPYDN